jgi:alpha-L-rhamnosidase/Glycosyl hydrolases family 2, sugar binding domain
MASEHYGTVAEVAHANGLIVYGEALEDHRPSLGDDMSMRSHADVPMAAMWTHTRESGPRLSYVADIKGAASVAHIYGQNLVAAESMTASMNPWNYAPNDLRRVIDLEFVTGVNRPVIHTSVHQPVDDKIPGLSLFIFGQYFNRHESWAEMAKPWVDYLSRTSYLLQAGRNVADVGYFYGEEAPLTGLYGDARVADAPRANAYDFVNFDALNGALSNHGNDLMTPGGAHYRALYLGGSSRMMSLAALRRIAALVEGGATVIGMKPEGNPGLSGDQAEYTALLARLWPGGAYADIGRGRVIATGDVEAALNAMRVAPDFSFSGGQDGSDIPFVHRQLADGDAYFLVNRKNRAETISARFRVSGRVPELWNAETGVASPVSYRIENGETVVPITLLAEKSLFVVFRRAATATSWTAPVQQFAASVALTGSWNVAFQPGRGAPASTVLPSLASLSEQSAPGIKYFSGIATYSQSFTAPRGWRTGQAAMLNLGQVAELAEVSVNGRVVGSVWQAPYALDIGPALRRGRNRIEVRVANTWVNRLTGDAQPGAQPITWTAMPTYSASAPLRPSGLIGPVTISVGSAPVGHGN